MDNNTMKITKMFLSLNKEKLWLEEMALNGWKLKELVMGIKYTFTKIQPTHLVYEIDRFDYSAQPDLSEIHAKSNFLDMANEMGWEVVTHDETLNYYLCKEYVEDECNELYTDYDQRQTRAIKFKDFYNHSARLLAKLGMGISIFAIIICALLYVIDGSQSKHFTTLYMTFVFFYDLFVIGMFLLYQFFAEFYYNEMIMPMSDWIKMNSDKSNQVVRHRFFISPSSMTSYLNKMSAKGFNLIKMTNTKLYFTSTNKNLYYYHFDNIFEINKRLKDSNKEKLHDSKDMLNINIDWLSISALEAQDKGMEYVCAVSNKCAIYRTTDSSVKLSDYVPSTPKNIAAIIGIVSLICLLIGAVAGVLFVIL